MTDFVDPLEEPFAYDQNPRAALGWAEQDAQAAEYDREHRDEEGENPDDADEPVVGPADADDGTEVTSASEGDPLDPTTPVDSLE